MADSMRNMTAALPDVLIRAEADTGEGPVLDHRTGLLAWVDIPAGSLHQTDTESGVTTSDSFPTMLGAVAPRRAHEGWAAAVREGFAILDGTSIEIVAPVLQDPAHRMNDAKCDPAGRMWAGSTRLDFATGAGCIHRWSGGDSSTVMKTGLTLPNGLGWSPDGTVMYFIDSLEHVVYSAPYDVDDGVMGDSTLVCEISAGLPDGMCVAEDGSFWVAIWGAGEVQRRSPTGDLLGRIRMPVSRPASCALSDKGQLFITTARSGLTAEQLVEQPLAGSVFALDVGVGPAHVASFDG